MSGRIKKMIDLIIKERAMGDPFLERTTKTKLLLKGINPNVYTDKSKDDPVILAKLENIAKEIDIKLF